MDVRIASHHFPCFPIRRERPTVRRFLAQASQFGTLPMVCVPLWVASPADRPARTPRCVKSALEQGARQNCQELAALYLDLYNLWMSVARRAAFLLIDAHASVPLWDACPDERPMVGPIPEFSTQSWDIGPPLPPGAGLGAELDVEPEADPDVKPDVEPAPSLTSSRTSNRRRA